MIVISLEMSDEPYLSVETFIFYRNKSPFGLFRVDVPAAMFRSVMIDIWHV